MTVTGHCAIVLHMPDDELLTSAQAGLLVNKSARTIRRHAAQGKLPVAQKIGGQNGDHLFRRTDVLTAFGVEDVAA